MNNLIQNNSTLSSLRAELVRRGNLLNMLTIVKDCHAFSTKMLAMTLLLIGLLSAVNVKAQATITIYIDATGTYNGVPNSEVSRGEVESVVTAAGTNRNAVTDVIFNNPTSILSIGNDAFVNCVALKNITLPPNLVNIGDLAFDGCVALKNIILPPNLEYIGGDGFYSCIALEEIVIPASVTNIGYAAFGECIALKNITFLSKEPPIIETNAFLIIHSTCVITIPHDADIVAWKAAFSIAGLPVGVLDNMVNAPAPCPRGDN